MKIMTNCGKKIVQDLFFFQQDISYKDQIDLIKHNITDEKDILAIRWPSKLLYEKNNIINNVILGKGIKINDKTWYPKEMWIYGMHE